MIARKHQVAVAAGQREGRVVGGVSGRVQCLDRPSVARNHLTVAGGDVRDEIHVGAFLERIDFARVERPSRPVRTLGHHRGACLLLQARGQRRMIPVGVGDEDMAHRSSRDR